MSGLILAFALVGCAETTPEAEEAPLYSEDAMVIDFGEGLEEGWFGIDDTVMGGVSSSTLSYTDASMLFEGEVSTDNNGGFSQVRSRSRTMDLTMYDRLVIRLRSEGQPFSFVITDAPFFFQPTFKADLEVPDDGWHVLEIPFDDFEEHAFIDGKPTPTGVFIGRRNLRNVDHFELISELFENGPFRLEVDWVAFD
jgi:hypothetical protein